MDTKIFQLPFEIFQPQFAIIGILVTAIAMTIAMLASIYAISQGQKSNPDPMDRDISDFNPTMANEGASVPLIYGFNRLPGNLIWYGNYRTEDIVTETSGGKGGGGGGKSVSGYKTYVDAWQVICQGRALFQESYIDDISESPIGAVIFNDGASSSYPDIGKEWAGSLPGLTHWSCMDWYLGDNKTAMPVIHFVVRRWLETPVIHQNMVNGSNPAAVIYDLLIENGTNPTKIDLPSFNVAAQYYYTKGYGLNIKFDSQTKGYEAIKKVQRYVDCVVYVDNEGRHSIKALDKNDPFVMEVDENNYKQETFSAHRETWKQAPNTFIATYIDKDQEYTDRTIKAVNPAAYGLAEREIRNTIDLKCFIDRETAEKRLTEIRDKESYPPLSVKFTSNLSLAVLKPGNVIRIHNAEYGINGADYRMRSIDTNEIDKNEIGVELDQMVEALHDDVFQSTSGPQWETPDNTPQDLTYKRVFELPYNSQTGGEPAFLVMAARERLRETGLVVLVSDKADQDYTTACELTTYAQRGTLDAEYSNLTRNIDDSQGIFFTPYKFDPQFTTISRSQLFSIQRVAVIGQEMLAFEQVTALGSGKYKLLGCIRGILGTEKATHVIGSEIWITYISNNILSGIKFSKFFVKGLPRILREILDPSDTTGIEVNVTNKARKPRRPGWIVAIRSGNNITFQIYPTTPGIAGAGDDPATVTDQAPPFAFLGDFLIEWGSSSNIQTVDNFVIIEPAAFTFSVKSRVNGFVSSAKTIYVGTGDGVYKA